jgi:hypothetical protein
VWLPLPSVPHNQFTSHINNTTAETAGRSHSLF